GGEKISPAEVDEVFNQHPHVAEVLTFAVPDERLGEEVAIAVVPTHPGAVTAAQLQRFATSRLASYKIPRQIYFLDRIPLGASGKPSRQAVREALPVLASRPAPVHLAPRTPLEKTLARLWSETLRVAEPGVHDSFFDSGGDSLNAVYYLASISEELKRDRLPIGVLLEAPTIAELAALLSDGHTPPGSGVIALQPHGSRLPLFVIGVQIETCRLANALERDQPVFAVPTPEPENFPATIEAAAGFCLAALKQFRPSGPYLLAGWCAYGVIAYEMARRLDAEGHEVPLLALFDSRGVLFTAGDGPSIGEEIRFHGRKMLGMSPPGALAYLSRRVRVRLRALTRRLKRTMLPTNGAHSIGSALRAYQPGPYDGRAVHFWALDRWESLSRLKTEWGPVTRGPVTHHEIPGDHSTIWQAPNVGSMARILTFELRKGGREDEGGLTSLRTALLDEAAVVTAGNAQSV
ncbi:MAG: thioesterase domain-containing protein, partial [Bryobacteraceae bacterium]